MFEGQSTGSLPEWIHGIHAAHCRLQGDNRGTARGSYPSGYLVFTMLSAGVWRDTKDTGRLALMDVRIHMCTLYFRYGESL